MAENTSMTLAGQEMPCEPGKREQMAVTWQPGDRAAWAEGLAAWQAEMGGGSAREYILWLIATSKRVRGDDELVRRLEAAGVDQIVAAHWQRRKAEDRLLEAIADAVAAARATAEQAVADELAGLRGNVERQEAEIGGLRGELGVVTAERDELEAAVVKAITMIAQRDAALDVAVKSAQGAFAKHGQDLVMQIQDALEIARDKMIAKDKEINDLTARVNAAEAKANEAEAKIRELSTKETDVIAAREETFRARNEVKILSAELSEARAAVDSKDKALSTAMIDMAANRATAEAQAATITDLRATIESLRDALAAIGDKAQTAASNIPSLADLDKVQTLDDLDELVVSYEAKAGKGKHKSVIGLLASLLREPRKPKTAEMPPADDRSIFEIARTEIEWRRREIEWQRREAGQTQSPGWRPGMRRASRSMMPAAEAPQERPASDPYPEGVEIDPVRDDPDPEPPATDGAPVFLDADGLPMPEDPGPLSAADLFAADAAAGADDIPEPEFAPAPELPDPDPFGPLPDPFAEEPQNGPQEPRKGRGRRKG